MAEKLQFFVYLVESPSARDIYHGVSEAGLIARTLELEGIPCVTRTAISPEAFAAALVVGLPEAMKEHEGLSPVIHVSAHGGADGIQLSSEHILTWAELREYLVPINQSLNGALLLCMSACEGLAASRMAMHADDSAPHPYFALVGNFGQPTWPDTAVAYLVFYHNLLKGKQVGEAIEAMNVGSGDGHWAVDTATNIQRSYVEYLKNSVKPESAPWTAPPTRGCAAIPPSLVRPSSMAASSTSTGRSSAAPPSR